MARDRVRSQQATPSPEQSPWEEKTNDTDESVIVTRKEKNGIERALLHLSMFEAELRALVADKSKTAGPLRRRAGVMKMPFDGDVKTWMPIKLPRELLEFIQAEMT